MATTPVTEPAAPAPPSAASAAKTISLAELKQEIQPRMPELPAEGAQRPNVLPEPKEQKPSPANPGFKDALRKRVMDKPEEEAKEEPAKKVVTFEAKVAPAKKEAVTADDAPPPGKSATPEEVPDDQRKVLPHDKPDTARRIKAILAERDAARQEATAAKAEYEAAKKAPATPPEELAKLKADHEAAQADLMRLRRLHEIKNDAEFNAKYDEPVKQANASITETLKRYGFADGTMKAIEAEGGFAAFSRSNKTFTIQEADPDNPGQTKSVPKTAAQLARGWLDGMNVADAEAIRASLGKQQLLQGEKEAAIQKAQEEAKGYFENQSKAQREAAAQAQESTQKATKEYEAWVSKAEVETDFLKDRVASDTASEAEKKAVEEYNEFNKQLRASLKKHPTTALEYGQLKLEAAEAHHLRRTLGDKDAEIAALKEQLGKAKGAMRTTPRGGSILKSDAPPEKQGGIDPKDPTNFKAALRRRMQAGGVEE